MEPRWNPTVANDGERTKTRLAARPFLNARSHRRPLATNVCSALGAGGRQFESGRPDWRLQGIRSGSITSALLHPTAHDTGSRPPLTLYRFPASRRVRRGE